MLKFPQQQRGNSKDSTANNDNKQAIGSENQDANLGVGGVHAVGVERVEVRPRREAGARQSKLYTKDDDRSTRERDRKKTQRRKGAKIKC